MFNRLLALFLIGMMVWHLVQWIRRRFTSHGVSFALALSLLITLITSHTAFYVLSVALIFARYYSIWVERRRSFRPRREEPRSADALAKLVETRVPPRRLQIPIAEDSTPVEAVVPVRGALELRIACEAVSVPCKGGGHLEIAAGELRVRVSVDHRRKPEIDRIHSTLVLTDSEGQDWELRSRFDASLFTDEFEADARRAVQEAGAGFVLWTDAPQEWKRALHERCMLKLVRQLMDSRMYVYPHIGGRKRTVRFKYEAPAIDVAIVDMQLLVRVSELNELVDDDFAQIPPFAYLAPASLLLPFATRKHHRPILDEAEKTLPKEERKLVRAQRLETRSEPQPTVMFRAD